MGNFCSCRARCDRSVSNLFANSEKLIMQAEVITEVFSNFFRLCLCDITLDLISLVKKVQWHASDEQEKF